MALIGTISGSVGSGGLLTSTTAISGTLIIADSPSSRFPALASGVKLFVSGNKSTGGLDAPSVIFGGDAFTSGTFGSAGIISGSSDLRIGGNITGSSMLLTSNLVVTGSTTIGSVVENLINSNGSTGTTTFNLNLQGIFYVNAPAGDITANFTNVPTTNLKVITPTVILSQSASPATPRIVSIVQIDTVPQTINWANGTTPTGTAGKQDVFGFSLIRSGSAWKVLGQMSTYG